MNDTLSVSAYLKEQSGLDTLRFITCGSVDDGKSTLIGRMLYEAKALFDDQVDALQVDSKKHGTQGEDIDFALLVDGLSAEREQGITIDVAYRFFTTDKRRFIVADTPGHNQYTRNMATGASTASLAIILVDARQGILEQTRRHSYICQLMGIRQIILAVNKMDLVNYDKDVFDYIAGDYDSFSAEMNFADVTAIPVSALKGDHINSRSAAMKWYRGPTLISKLETVPSKISEESNGFAMPVQLVNRPNSEFRGYSGVILRKHVSVGEQVRIAPSGSITSIKHIWLANAKLDQAEKGLSVTLELADDVDISRGEVIASHSQPVEVADQFEVDLVWMAEEHAMAGRGYQMKLAGQMVSSSILSIKHKLDINTGINLAAKTLQLNDIARVSINCQKPICFDAYKQTPELGAFILIDPVSNQTVAAGMIHFALRRAGNIHHQKLDVNKEARRTLNGHTSKVFWFTGLSGSGKSTIANALCSALHARGICTYLLDGDNIRHGINKDLGFNDADRVENIRRVAEIAKLMVDAGLVVLTAFISPFRAERDMARHMFEKDEFIEVFVNTPLEICEQRDAKGLYKKARAGDIPNFTGIGSAYEEPEHPQIILDPSQDMDDMIAKLSAFLSE